MTNGRRAGSGGVPSRIDGMKQVRTKPRSLRRIGQRLGMQLLEEGTQAEAIEELRDVLRECRWSLVLGSGVSHTVGIPMWRPLVVEMIGRACGNSKGRPGRTTPCFLFGNWKGC